MKKITMIGMALLALAPALFAQDFDFKSLDKLGANATSSTNVTLDADMLKMASGFLNNKDKSDKDIEIQSLTANLKAIYVREFKFDKPGQYSDSDLAPLRAYLKKPKWQNVVDVHDQKETTQVYFAQASDTKLGGIAVVSAEPTQLTVVYIEGNLNMNDLKKLSGNMGIPDMKSFSEFDSPGDKAKPTTTK